MISIDFGGRSGKKLLTLRTATFDRAKYVAGQQIEYVDYVVIKSRRVIVMLLVVSWAAKLWR